MVVQHPDGTLFVGGYGEPGPKLWKSRDDGKTWTRVNVGTEQDGAIGNSDVDLAVARDGTLYFVTMGFDAKTMKGTHIAVGVSGDVGATWRWTLLSKQQLDDRPWVAVTDDGTAHVIWNDGSGVSYAQSRDRGITWDQRQRINDKGGSSHLAVGPNRLMAVRVTPGSASGRKFDLDVDFIAVSTDGGATWKKHTAPGQRKWSASFFAFPQRWVEPLAWDARGDLYSFWTNPDGLWLARSTDQGETWTSWHIADCDEPSYFPYLIARGQGELAATWFSARGEVLKAHLAKIDVTDYRATPQFVESQPFQPDSWYAGSRNRDTAGEYLGVTFLHSGGIGVVTAIQSKQDNRFGFTWWKFEAR